MTYANMLDHPDSASESAPELADYLSYHTTPLIKIVVGGLAEPEHNFLIHEGLLIGKSDFFKSATHKYFTSGMERTVQLRDVDAKIFSEFARWVYDSRDLIRYDYVHLAKAYVLGDQLLAPTFKHDILEAVKEAVKDDLKDFADDYGSYDADLDSKTLRPWNMEDTVHLATMIYEGTSLAEDDFRSLLTAYVARSMHAQTEHARKSMVWKPDDIKVLVQNSPEEFLCDVLSIVPKTCTADEDWMYRRSIES